MRAIVARRLGGPDVLELATDVEPPQARAGQVVVAVSAAALNFPDLLTLQGTYQHRQEAPYVPGMEGVGRVVSVGPGVDDGWLGRRVMFGARATLAELVAASVAELVEAPVSWSDQTAAAFPVISRTAYHALVQRARLAAGETLLVNGAAGGTGHMAVKLGKALGARVVATARGADRLQQVAAFGADALVDNDAQDLADRIKSVAPEGVHVVFDPVGGKVFEAALKASAFGGRIAVVGFAAGSHDTVRTNYALIKGLSILGVRAGEAARRDPRIAAAYARELPRLAAAHDLAPHVGAVFALEDAAAAFACLMGRGAFGKVVIAVSARAP